MLQLACSLLEKASIILCKFILNCFWKIMVASSMHLVTL